MFLTLYAAARDAILREEWPVPSEEWVAHMVVIASYFDDALRVRVREGLLAAIRWRRRQAPQATPMAHFRISE